MNKNIISIVVPFKNEADYLLECLESILEQYTQDFDLEVLLVDDHSTDGSPRIAAKFCKENKTFYYFKSMGSGVVDALHLGLVKSTGNYIHRMDADDVMPANKLLNLFHLLVNNPSIKVATGKVSYFREDQPLGDGFKKYEQWLNLLVDSSSFYDFIYQECPVASANWLMRKSDLISLGGFGKDYPEDYDLIFRVYKSKFQIKGVDQITHLWRDHAQRASRKVIHYRDNNFFELKIRWFLQIDYRPQHELFIYGAGKKGKKIAQILQDKNIPFRWFTNNTKKIGKDIYGVVLESDSVVFAANHPQILVLISNPKEKQKVIEQCLAKGWTIGFDFFLFG